MVSRKISLFGKMQRGRSPSFELFQLDMYGMTERNLLVPCHSLKLVREGRMCLCIQLFYSAKYQWALLLIENEFAGFQRTHRRDSLNRSDTLGYKPKFDISLFSSSRSVSSQFQNSFRHFGGIVDKDAGCPPGLRLKVLILRL